MLKGRDKLGRPILYIALGGVDVPALERKGVSIDDLIRCSIRSSEQVRLAVESSVDPLAGHLLINDLGLGTDNPCTATKFITALRFWVAQGALGQNYYPEMLGHTCVIRGPPAAAWAVTQIKRFLDKKTADKIELTSCDPYIALGEYISADVLSELDSEFKTARKQLSPESLSMAQIKYEKHGHYGNVPTPQEMAKRTDNFNRVMNRCWYGVAGTILEPGLQSFWEINWWNGDAREGKGIFTHQNVSVTNGRESVGPEWTGNIAAGKLSMNARVRMPCFGGWGSFTAMTMP